MTSSVAPSRSEVADVILARLADGTIARGTWAGRTADGRDTACLIAVIVPGLAHDARPVGAEHLLPPWLAELTLFVNDAPPTEAAWPALVRRYAEALRASDVLTPEAWRRLDYRCRRAALVDALACAGPAKQVVERSIALCDRTIAGDPPTPEECRAARIAARAAVVSGASEAAARAAEDRVRSALEVCCCAADAAATAAGKRAVNRVDDCEARGFRYGFNDAGFAAWKQEVSAAGDRIFGSILDAWECEIRAATGGGQ